MISRAAPRIAVLSRDIPTTLGVYARGLPVLVTTDLPGDHARVELSVAARAGRTTIDLPAHWLRDPHLPRSPESRSPWKH